MKKNKTIKFIKKLTVKDILLLCRIIFFAINCSLFKNANSLNESVKVPIGKNNTDKNHILNAVNFVVFFLKHLGLKFTCFTNAVILTRFMRLNGYNAVVAFGAAKFNSELKGHAWVECDGKPFFEKISNPMKKIYTVPER